MVEYMFLWIERFVWDPLVTFTGPKAWKMRFPGPPAMSDQDGLNHIFLADVRPKLNIDHAQRVF